MHFSKKRSYFYMHLIELEAIGAPQLSRHSGLNAAWGVLLWM